MPFTQVNITLGTAGHIDHGKTALVRCLTGCETDRLKEEIDRGMSIDLGYAPCLLGDLQVGIVDVPGHENFIKTMVAGASGIDGVILVVAADDGVMPQTREHLDILTLLGIRHGLVALTKIDRVAAEHLELARAELAEFLRGTFLEEAPILPLSNATGEGFDRLFDALAALVRSICPKRSDGVFRLPLDRAFSAKGFGTVVAGIPVSGAARVHDEVVLLPQGQTGRIKRIQVYGRESDVVTAGQCAALNVGHWDPRTIARGDVLALPGYFTGDEWHAASLRLLDRKLTLKNGAKVKLHTGASEAVAGIYAIEGGSISGDGEHFVQFRLERPLVAAPGDRYILRTLSPVRTAGGGILLKATGRRLKRNRPGVCEALRERAEAIGDESRFVECCIRHAQGPAVTEMQLVAQTKLLRGRLQEILASLTQDGRVLALAPGLYLHRDAAAAAARRIVEAIGECHRRSPESPGVAPEPLQQALEMEKAVLQPLLSRLAGEGRVVERNGRWALPDHRPTVPAEDSKCLEAVEGLYRQRPFSPPGVEKLAALTGEPRSAVEKAVRILKEHRRLVFVGEGLWFHCEAVERARELLVAHLRKEGRLESVEFKYLLDTTRKFALPLLDYFDRTGLLRRVGNTRHLKNPVDRK